MSAYLAPRDPRLFVYLVVAVVLAMMAMQTPVRAQEVCPVATWPRTAPFAPHTFQGFEKEAAPGLDQRKVV